MQRFKRLAAAAAVALFTLALAAHAGLEMGLHAGYLKSRGVKADAVLERFDVPKGRRPGGFHDKQAVLRFTLAGGAEQMVTLPVSDAFYERYRGELGSRLSLRVLPGSRLLRPVMDEDPRSWGWLWPAAILVCGLLIAALVAATAREPRAAPAPTPSPG